MAQVLKVLTIGGATQDVIIEYNASPSCISVTESTGGQQLLTCKEGSKIEVQRLHHATGGGATNAAVSFKRLGCDASAFFKIGSDEPGKFIVERLEQHGIHTFYKKVSPTPSGTSFIIPTPGKDRIIFAYRGANGTLQANDITQELIADHDLVYITSLSDKAAHALPYLVRMAQKSITQRGVRVAVNPGTSQLTSNVHTLKASLPDINILILNTEEMKLLMGSLKPRFFKSAAERLIKNGPELLNEMLSHDTITFTLQDYFKEILSYGVKRIVVTNGKEGVYVATRDHIYFHPSLEGPVVNTVGAGDAFGSCFTALLAQGSFIEEAIRGAVIQAQSVIAFQDAKSGLLFKQDLEKKIRTIDASLLKVFDS